VSGSDPVLTVLAVSDSFNALWAGLALECRVELVVTPDPALKVQAGQLVVINGAGMENALGQIAAPLVEAGAKVCAVGAQIDHRIALPLIRAGVAEYFALPAELDGLRTWLAHEAEALRTASRTATFASGEARKYRFEGILGDSPALRDALALASRVIPHATVTVLITGETGTGKELLARALHYNGPRRSAPFVDINCAAIPENLLESELFGHEKGAFTDASAAKPGLFEVANGGTIFLDEIGHLSPQLQGKLLRVLEQREIRRLGGTSSMPIDVRVIAATHVDLAEASRRGEFREDLYYRLNVVGLRLPALRERAHDVLLLTRAFLARFSREYGVPLPELTTLAERRLVAHPWAGNIRELRNVLERAILMLDGPRLDADHLGLAQQRARVSTDGVPFPATMSDITRGAALAMTRLCEGNKSEAARRLSISRTRLLRLLAPRGAKVNTIDLDDMEDEL